MKKFIDALKEIMPLLAAFFWGKSMGDKKTTELEVKLEGAELELKKKENEALVKQELDKLGSDSIVARAIAKGRVITKADKP